MSEPLAVEILLVEDSPSDLKLALRALKKANLTNRIHIARDGAEALDFIFCEGAHIERKNRGYAEGHSARSETPQDRRAGGAEAH